MAGLNSESPICCCLCCTDISLAKGIRKHKKYNGASCASEREVLDIAIQNSGVDIEVVQKNFEGGITICYGCSLKLTKIKKLVAEMEKLRREVHNYLLNIQQQKQQEQQMEPLRRSHTTRLSESESDCCPPNKVARSDIPSRDSSPKCKVSSFCGFVLVNCVHFCLYDTVSCEL